MSGSGVTYYQEELKDLLRLLKNLPDTIPIGNHHNFVGYAPDGKEVDKKGCCKSVVSHDIGSSFGQRRTPAGEDIIIAFKSRGPGLEQVVEVLRSFITGNGGPNVLLTQWVDDLRHAARVPIEASGNPLPRDVRTTAAKRLLESEQVEENAKKKAKKMEKDVKERTKAATEKAKKAPEQGAVNWPFTDLVDDPLPSPPTTAGPGKGCPKNTVLDQLTIPCHAISDGTARFRCAGEGCHESWSSPRQSGRVLPHSSACRYLSKDLKQRALEANAKASLGSKVDIESSEKTNIFSNFRKVGEDNKAAARQKHINKTDLLVLRLLVMALWLLRLVTVLSLQKLKNCDNVTISYDGGTTKGHQSIYTVHVTTAERATHLIKGDKASGFSHTGEHIKKVLMEVIKEIGEDRFTAIGSDSTGNTSWARDGVVDDIPTMLIVPDPCHHLSNTVGDITRLPYFANALTKMCTTISHFSHSSYSTTDLKALRVSQHINHGLEKVGKTRFGTIYWCIINTDRDKDTKAAPGWFKQILIYQQFELELKQLVTILEPLARAIKCLEGLEVTVGDVWKFYVAVTAVLRDLFTENILSFSQSLQDDICSIVNRRFDEMIHGPSGALYLAGFYLDPEHVKSPLLFRTTTNQLNTTRNPLSVPGTSASNVTDKDLRDSMPAYTKVGLFLLTVLPKELRAGRKHPAFVAYSSGNQILDAFKVPFESYTRQCPPFSARSTVWSQPIQYWTAMSQQPEASILALLAIKIFSILPNSMAEERTVSRFTHNDSVDQASQDASTIVNLTKIYQHIRREQLATQKFPKKKSRSSPTLNWRSVKALMTETVVASEPDTATNPTPNETRTAASDAGLTALNTENPSDPTSNAFPALGATSIDPHHDGVDITLPFFRDLLSDKPISGASVVGSLANWSEQRDEASSHAILAGDHIKTLKGQLNAKQSKARGSSGRTVHKQSRIVTTAKGHAAAAAQKDMRKERDTATVLRQTKKDDAGAASCTRRTKLTRLTPAGMIFTGTFKQQKLDSLRDLAWALVLDEKGTKNELLQRIEGHLALPVNVALHKDKHYVALFGKRKCTDETSDNEPAASSTTSPQPSSQRRRLDEVGNSVSSLHRPSTSQPGPSTQAAVHTPPYYPFPPAPPQLIFSTIRIGSSTAWTSDPFVLPPLPNKQLMWHHETQTPLPANLVFYFEGMEENGSEGLDELIEREAKEWFNGVDCYDNYWLNSARPRSRTVFEASCTSSSPSPDPAATLHYGVFGPTVHEPIDMGSVTDAEER
ncbi:ribonuclease H-like domain-containing protein [Mycena galopus ATCC 62051]|nr:ribonuclease H-like domain-containing protein [Mycena galopus ATCC 62051]